MDDILQDFLAETAERLATVDQDILLLEKNGQEEAALARIFRAAHNLKSSAGFLHLPRLQHLSHALEALLVPCRDGRLRVTPVLGTLLLAAFDRLRAILAGMHDGGAEPAGDDLDIIRALEQAARQESFDLPDARQAVEDTRTQGMRVDIDVLENLMALTGELVLLRNRLAQAGEVFDAAGRPVPLQHLHHLIAALQAEVLKSRMQPVMQGWRALPRLLRDAAAQAGKQARLVMTGGDTALDRLVLEAVRDPLAHLLRNAVAHGIETPEERQACGKPAEGTVHLGAAYTGGCVVMKLSDDGRGLDTAKIAAQAVTQGLATPDEIAAMSAADIWGFIFAGGFSTRAQADHLAGRGVGLDVVRAAVEKTGGSVAVESQEGRGTTFTLRLPLTLAIAPCVIVAAGGQHYALPQTAVREMLRLREDVETIGGQPVLRVRQHIVPLLPLAEALSLPKTGAPLRKAVLLQGARGLLALAVEDIARTEDIVVKPLPEIVRDAGCFLGSAVLADGALALIIDANRLMEKHMPARSAAIEPPAPQPGAEDAAESLAVLLFRPMGAAGVQALPLADVARLVDKAAARLAKGSDGDNFLRLEDDRFVLLHGDATTPPKQAVIARTGNGLLALGAAQVLDIVSVRQSALQAGEPARGIRHRFVWQDNLAELIDVSFHAPQNRIAPPETPAGRRVLLIDDSPFFCRLMRPLLQTAGYDVVSVESAAEAVALCRQGETFGAIISDIEMPGMNGLQLAAQIRALPSGRHMPLLAMSSYASARDEARARAAGFDCFLNKFDNAALMAALARLDTRGAA